MNGAWMNEAVCASDGYKNLVELLDHEGHLATVDVRLTLARDGRLRGFEIVRVAENKGNRYYVGPVGRWLARLKRLFFGYVLREDELLGRLVQTAYDGVEQPLIQLFQLQRDLEFYLAALGFRSFAEQKGLSVCLPVLHTIERTAPEGLEHEERQEILSGPDARQECEYVPGESRCQSRARVGAAEPESRARGAVERVG